MNTVFFDASSSMDAVDLEDLLRAQFGPGELVTSMPLFTTLVCDTALTVIRVTHKERTRHQLYAVDEGAWTLTGIFGNYTDAMSELLRWRRYINTGGGVLAWLANHPDGVYPERSSFEVIS
jgi:hypothetical protein